MKYFSSWCFCGNTYGLFGLTSNCNMPCTGNALEICGGSRANSIYQVSIPSKILMNKNGFKKLIILLSRSK